MHERKHQCGQVEFSETKEGDIEVDGHLVADSGVFSMPRNELPRLIAWLVEGMRVSPSER